MLESLKKFAVKCFLVSVIDLVKYFDICFVTWQIPYKESWNKEFLLKDFNSCKANTSQLNEMLIKRIHVQLTILICLPSFIKTERSAST